MASESHPGREGVLQKDKMPEDFWMVRPCETYLDEYKDCKSVRTKLHQYFIHGKLDDSKCEQWKNDYETCQELRKFRQFHIAESLIASEKKRKRERIADAKANDVWQYRTHPPPDWNKPLPEYLEKMKLPRVVEEQRCVIS